MVIILIDILGIFCYLRLENPHSKFGSASIVQWNGKREEN